MLGFWDSVHTGRGGLGCTPRPIEPCRVPLASPIPSAAWGFGVRGVAVPSAPSSEQAHAGGPHRQMPPRGPRPHPQHGEGRQWGGGQRVPSAGSAQGAQVDQDSEQGQRSAGRQDWGPRRPLADGRSHGAAASDTAVGLSSGERKHELGCCQAHHGTRWCSTAPGARRDPHSAAPRAGGLSRCSGRGHVHPGPRFPGSCSLPMVTVTSPLLSDTLQWVLCHALENLQIWVLFRKNKIQPTTTQPRRIPAPELPPSCRKGDGQGP